MHNTEHFVNGDLFIPQYFALGGFGGESFFRDTRPVSGVNDVLGDPVTDVLGSYPPRRLTCRGNVQG